MPITSRSAVRHQAHLDLYQLLAYVIGHDLTARLLIYAAGGAESVEHTVSHAGKRLQVTTIDLSGTPSAIFDRVHRLARRVRALADGGGEPHRSPAYASPAMNNQ